MHLNFLEYCIGKYPELPEVLDDLAHALCREEGIEVFHLAYEILNAGRKKGKEVLGLYTYTDCEEYQASVNHSRKSIEELEATYGKSYADVCEQMGHDTRITRADFVIPRITLSDSLKQMGSPKYYATFFHEIGHHFALKEQGPDHEESAADRHARMVFLQRLPPEFHITTEAYFKSRLREFRQRNQSISS